MPLDDKAPRAPNNSTVSEEFSIGSASAGLEKIRTRLLDLTARNKLLNFRHPKSSCLRFVETDLDSTFHHLIDGNALDVEFVPEPKTGIASSSTSSIEDGPEKMSAKEYAANELGWDVEFDLIDGNASPPKLRVLAYRDDLDRIAKKIGGTARTAMEESGANMLFLCFGFLEWRNSESDPISVAPLLIMPATIERERGPRDRGWVHQVQYSGEDLTTNLSLVEKMKRDFSIDIPFLSEDDTPSSYAESVGNAISTRTGWRVRDFLTLALLSFGRLLMFLDLNPARWPIKRPIASHPIIKDLFEGVKASNESFAVEYELDDEAVRSTAPALFYDADSSQHSALIDALEGKNLVIEGPPGTGKSQTITNLIASALAEGKSVLFVAEKMAALEVVYRRLNAIGLGLFCLELHSHSTQKRELINSLERRLSAHKTLGGAPTLEYKLAQAKETKGQLNKYVRLMNAPHPQFGSTTFDIIWAKHRAAMAVSSEIPDLESLMIRDDDRLTVPAYERGKHAIALFSVITKEMFQGWPNLRQHPWFGIESSNIGYSEQAEILEKARIACNLATACSEAVGKLKERGLDLPGCLADLDTCRSIRAKIPVKSPSPLLDMPSELHSDHFRNILADYCDRISSWRTTRSRILHFGELSTAIDAYPSILAELSREAGRMGAAELSLVDVNLLARKVEAILDDIPATISLFAWARSLHPELPSTGKGVEVLRALCKAFAVVPQADLAFRHPALLGEQSIPALGLALTQSNEIIARARKLGERFELSETPSPEELYDYAATLAASSFAGRIVRADCRRAIKTYRRLQKTPRRTACAEMVRALRELAEYKSRLMAFNSDSRFREIGGPFYSGVNTPWCEQLRLAEWLFNVSQGLDSASEQILQSLVTMPATKVRSLCTQLQNMHAEFAALNNLVSSLPRVLSSLPPSLLTSGGDTLEELGSSLRLISTQLDHLSALGRESGLRESLSLAHAANMYGLCDQNSSLASQIERLTQDLNLASLYDGPNTDIDRIRMAIAFAKNIDLIPVAPTLRKWLLQDFELNASLFCGELDSHIELMTQLGQALLFIAASGKVNNVQFWEAQSIDVVPFQAVASRLRRAVESPDELSLFVDWLRSWDESAAATSPALPKLVMTHDLAPDALPKIYEFVFYSSLAASCLAAQPDLMSFKGIVHDNIRARFASLDREIIGLNAKHAAAVLDARPVPMGSRSGPIGQWTDLSLIDHELAKQKRHIPIRQLVNRAGGALKALKPCFMMSPLSVAQYLEPGILNFDLIVMDEASQLRPEDALGAIARGSQLVVVGDPKQLPPTSFFERVLDDSETPDDELTVAEDAESILDVASSVYQPIRRLRWHYRSRHHTLIEFSNHEFYKNLIIFPSAQTNHPELGVKYVEVSEGRFINRRNLPEAQAVVSAAVDHMRIHPAESLGIVALNFEQRELIDDLLDQQAMTDPHAESFVSAWKDKSEPLFVKNLENVQGDERDVIFISTTYGPNEQGKQFQRFGPINGQHGHRRLNVLFTRAKKRVQVFSSLQVNNIITDGASWGVKVLRQYLEFARSGRIPEISGSGGDPDSDFEVSVAYILKSAGYEVVPQVGVAGFFIDLGVRDSTIPGRFLAGIECDGAAYHSAKSARDRDRLRQEILESHGWKIYRIWSTDWFKNRQHEEARLLQFLSAARVESRTV